MGRAIIGATYMLRYTKKPKRKQILRCYEERNNKLSELGMSYPDYLKTSEWQIIRKRVFEKYTHCFLCEKKADQVHHCDYEWETLLGLSLDALAVLCRDCHKWIEFEGERKRPVREATQTLIHGICSRAPQDPIAREWVSQYKRWTMLANRRRKEFEERQKQRILEWKQSIKKKKNTPSQTTKA